MYIYTQTHTHTHTHKYIYIYIYIYMWVYIYINPMVENMPSYPVEREFLHLFLKLNVSE